MNLLKPADQHSSPPRATTVLRACVVALAVWSAGCSDQDQQTTEYPLRPLLYTERPSDETVVPPVGYEMWDGTLDPTAYPDEPQVLQARRLADNIPADQVDLSTPEALARAVFRALVAQEEGLLHRTILTPAEYSDAARTSLQTAQEHMAEVERGTLHLAAFFRGESPSEQRPGGLGSLLQLESVTLTEGRLVTGAIARAEELPVMYWGIEVHMRLFDTNQLFRLRFPKILQAPGGRWGLAEAPEVDGMLQLYVQMGFHLSPTLLTFEHFPYPLQTGNYWTYRVREVPRRRTDEAEERDHQPSQDANVPQEDRPPQEAGVQGLADREALHQEIGVTDSEGAVGTGVGVLSPSVESAALPGESEGASAVEEEPESPFPRFTDEVVTREDYDGYSLVGIRRDFLDGSSGPRRYYYVLTARRVYRCDRDCRRNIGDIAWLLSHLSRRVPELVFPLQPSMGWRTGGRLDIRGEYRTRSRYEVADVPSGRFERTICISRSVTEGQEHRFFESGIGIVLTRIDGTTAIRYEELVDFRITP